MATTQSAVDKATPRPSDDGTDPRPWYLDPSGDIVAANNLVVAKTWNGWHNGELIVKAVNQSAGVDALILAATFARNRLLQDSGDQESIDKLNAALAEIERLRGTTNE